jgi:hypothetical protein
MFRFKAGRAAIMLVATLFASSVAQAVNVTYSTSGSFDGGGSTKVIGVGPNALTLTFVGINMGTVDASPMSFASLGFIDSSSTSQSNQSLAGIDFELTITQHIPAPGGFDSITAVLSGVMSGFSSAGIIDFGGIFPVNIQGITYQNTATFYPLVPLSSNNGRVSIQGMITADQRDPVVPEPGTTFLLGSGISVIALLGRKFRRAESQS